MTTFAPRTGPPARLKASPQRACNPVAYLRLLTLGQRPIVCHCPLGAGRFEWLTHFAASLQSEPARLIVVANSSTLADAWAAKLAPICGEKLVQLGVDSGSAPNWSLANLRAQKRDRDLRPLQNVYAAAEQHHTRLRHTLAVYESLRQFAQTHQTMRAMLTELKAGLDAAPEQIAHDAADPTHELSVRLVYDSDTRAAQCSAIDAEVAVLESQLQKTTELSRERGDVAKPTGNIFSWTYWKALLAPEPGAIAIASPKQSSESESEHREQQIALERIRAERSKLATDTLAARDTLVAAELRMRREKLSADAAICELELSRLEDQFSVCTQRLHAAELPWPTACDPVTVTIAQQAATERVELASHAMHTAKVRLQELESQPIDSGCRIVSDARIVVGTHHADWEEFQKSGKLDEFDSGTAQVISYVVFDDADQLTHPPSISPCVPGPLRMILVGHYSTDATELPPHAGYDPLNNGHYEPVPTPSAAVQWLAALPTSWQRLENQRLRVTLAPGTVITEEPLADRPEVQLGFGYDQDQEYSLLAIEFPDSESIDAIKRFLMESIETVPVVCCGEAVWHDENRLTVCWLAHPEATFDVSNSDDTSMSHSCGIREWYDLVNGVPYTTRFDFDHEWTKEQAQAWLAARVQEQLAFDLEPFVAHLQPVEPLSV